MFFCDDCARRHGWPESMFRSRGACESCGVTAVCNEVASALLPVSDARPPQAAEHPAITHEERHERAAEFEADDPDLCASCDKAGWRAGAYDWIGCCGTGIFGPCEDQGCGGTCEFYRDCNCSCHRQAAST